MTSTVCNRLLSIIISAASCSVWILWRSRHFFIQTWPASYWAWPVIKTSPACFWFKCRSDPFYINRHVYGILIVSHSFRSWFEQFSKRWICWRLLYFSPQRHYWLHPICCSSDLSTTFVISLFLFFHYLYSLLFMYHLLLMAKYKDGRGILLLVLSRWIVTLSKSEYNSLIQKIYSVSTSDIATLAHPYISCLASILDYWFWCYNLHDW